MNAIPSEPQDTDALDELISMIDNRLIIPVLRPDGQTGWMPAWKESSGPMPTICAFCGGEGFLSEAMAALITADFRLTNLCPECNGTGIIEDGQPLESATLPETQPLPERGALGGAS